MSDLQPGDLLLMYIISVSTMIILALAFVYLVCTDSECDADDIERCTECDADDIERASAAKRGGMSVRRVSTPRPPPTAPHVYPPLALLLFLVLCSTVSIANAKQPTTNMTTRVRSDGLTTTAITTKKLKVESITSTGNDSFSRSLLFASTDAADALFTINPTFGSGASDYDIIIKDRSGAQDVTITLPVQPGGVAGGAPGVGSRVRIICADAGTGAGVVRVTPEAGAIEFNLELNNVAGANDFVNNGEYVQFAASTNTAGGVIDLTYIGAFTWKGFGRCATAAGIVKA